MQLPAIQARRIYARFYLGMAVAEIARIEGADRRRVWAEHPARAEEAGTSAGHGPII